MHFVMTIGGHPVRFYRGEPNDVPSRYQYPSFPELIEQEKALALDGALPKGRSLRIAIVNDANGKPSNIYLVETDDAEVVVARIFPIPVLAEATTVVDFIPAVEPAQIPPVSAEAIEGEEQDIKGREGTTDSDNE